MNQSSNDHSNGNNSAESAARRPNTRRRRLIVGSASAASLVMTVASRPAWAGGNICTPSALASANLSGRHDFDGCSKSAGYWKTKQLYWPEGVLPGDSFVGIFGPVLYNGEILFDGLTLGQVINLPGSNPNGSNPNPHMLGLHTVGAYVNAHAFPGYFSFTPEEVVSLFQSEAGTNTENLAINFEDANNLYDAFTEWK